ncbi:MAG: hypothetical protein EOO70_02795 [Myxococcaceae bacterium]|nr:MAG: hypothetical protein EOO70_02795 [Myxococcaceae bacterium]
MIKINPARVEQAWVLGLVRFISQHFDVPASSGRMTLEAARQVVRDMEAIPTHGEPVPEPSGPGTAAH